MGEKIETSLTFLGFAWIEDDGSLNWAMREDLQDVLPQDRPSGCTPVVIEITPTEEWVMRKQREYDFLGNVASSLNSFTSEIEDLKRHLQAES